MKDSCMVKKSVSKLLVTLLMLLLVIVGGTFAWFTYKSRETSLVLSIGDINDSKVIIKPYQIKETLTPVNIYTSGVYSQISVNNNNNENYLLSLFYLINELDEVLINNGLKYTIVVSDSIDGIYTEVLTNDFAYAVGTDKLEILSVDINANTTMYYRVYLWLDSNFGNQVLIQNSVINLELNANIESKNLFDDHSLMITSYTCKDANGNNVSVGDNPYFTYTGQCEVIDDGDGDWRIRFLTDGTFTSTLNIPIDAFLVGGGGGGGAFSSTYYGGGGGGGGYTSTTFVNIKSNVEYDIDVGDGGGAAMDGKATTGFGGIAFGGQAGGSKFGGTGGSGGGAGGYSALDNGSSGGSDGSDGSDINTHGSIQGNGQEKTTREFGESSGDLYAGGGGGGGGSSTGGITSGGEGGLGGGASGGRAANGNSAANNTGGGGGGGGAGNGGSGGSGIVVIRNRRNDINLDELDFEYTGNYLISKDSENNWKVDFLTSGIFVSNKNMIIDVFLVGGGGGGGYSSSTYYGGGGGGGGYVNSTIIEIEKGLEYNLIIGEGGEQLIDGGNTSGFGSIANGGVAGIHLTGGSGGSGGGSGGYSALANGSSAGSNGSDGGDTTKYGGVSGAGQEISTREFGDSSRTLYAGGGGGGSGSEHKMLGGAGGNGGGGEGGDFCAGSSGVNGLGGGGGGGSRGNNGGNGGSGIIVIKKSNISDIPFEFEYTGKYTFINDENGNWRIKFLTNGTFTPYSNLLIDAFLVGGGGGGGYSTSTYVGGGGGGSGKTITSTVNLISGISYDVVIGNGGTYNVAGESTSAFGIMVSGGSAGLYNGGEGGSGGGGGGFSSWANAGGGGTDGGAGITGGGDATSGNYSGGTGQGTTTYEFEDLTSTLYAGGGGGGGGNSEGSVGALGGTGGGGNGGSLCSGTSAIVNSGGGGGGGARGYTGGTGGSGIVVIRNAR